MRAGTYNTQIAPSNSGSSGNVITYRVYNGEAVTINNTTIGIYLNGKSYIKIDGITVTTPIERLFLLTNGASYNELANCTFSGVGSVDTPKIWDGQTVGGTPCANNWIHGCTFSNIGEVTDSCDDKGGLQIGVPSYDNESNYNTIEDNIFYCGGHHNLETYTKYNVIRNNYFHHEGCMDNPGGCTYGPDTNGKYGKRNIQIYDGYGEDKYNLIEGNRFGTSGPPPDDDGGDGFTITAPKNIIRYNVVFNGQNNGILMKLGASSRSDNNRIYNNTITKNGRYQNSGPQWQGYNLRWYISSGDYAIGNVVKNNIFYSATSGDIDYGGQQTNIEANNTIVNNWLTSNGDPLFKNPDFSTLDSQTIPDLRLNYGSGAIDNATHLTQANGSGASSTTLIVDDALYFQDGSWGSSLSSIQADWIAIGAVTNVVQISSIDYSTNTITLSQPMSWNDSDSIYLYKRSDGTRILYGPAPDQGAYEYMPGGITGGGTSKIIGGTGGKMLGQ